MIADVHRARLRSAASRLQVGLFLLFVSVGSAVARAAPPAESESAPSGGPGPAALLGILGSLVLLAGLVPLAFTRVGGRRSSALFLAALAWAIVLALQLEGALPGEPGADPAMLRLLRVLLASAAGVGLARGVLHPWGDAPPASLRLGWMLVRRLFVVQLAVYVVFALAVLAGDDPAREVYARWTGALGAFGLPLAWLLFAGPFVALLAILRATARQARDGPAGMQPLRP